MKLLFVASRDPESLMIQREITLLQQRAWLRRART